MKIEGEAQLLRIFIGESDRWHGAPLHEAIVARARELGLAGPGFPLGTWAVNVAGCLGLGALMGLADTRLGFTPEARLFLGIGVLGSLTTFSTFGYETIELLRASQLGLALANVAGNLLVGCGAVVAGRPGRCIRT